jgi:tRNA(His) 5'-end guanylyltransferase
MRAGHTFTRGFARPFDEVFGNTMVRTMEYCAKNIGNCVFAYCQSDEITFILVDYAKLETDAWFDYRTDKLCSISASMATMAFNKYFSQEHWKWAKNNDIACMEYLNESKNPELLKLHNTYVEASCKGAMFDARCFNIPKEEACNLVYWRQLDATRNSIQMVGQANFSHSELQGCSCNVIQDMLHEQRGINWNDFPTRWKRGIAWTRARGVDFEMPILKGEDRKYVDKVIYVGEGM